VVGDEPQLELRFEFRILSVQEARCNSISAGDLLDERLIQLTIWVRLDGSDHSGALESSQIVVHA
jgi:hypothetical protein